MKTLVLLVALITFTLGSCATRVVHTTPATSTLVVKTPPRNYKVVRVKGKRYYKWNGKHYKKTRRGYVIVTL